MLRDVSWVGFKPTLLWLWSYVHAAAWPWLPLWSEWIHLMKDSPLLFPENSCLSSLPQAISDGMLFPCLSWATPASILGLSGLANLKPNIQAADASARLLSASFLMIDVRWKKLSVYPSQECQLWPSKRWRCTALPSGTLGREGTHLVQQAPWGQVYMAFTFWSPARLQRPLLGVGHWWWLFSVLASGFINWASERGSLFSSV